MALTSDSQPPPSRSRTSSTSTYSFPRTSSPTKESTSIKPTSNAVKPNAHPYAIKTTSTGVLSRSSSSPHHQVHSTALTQHHYVPATPSSSGQVSPTKYKPHRESRHRYSRSLTSEEPKSLPVPPSRSPSPSPAPGGADEEDDNTPRMRPRTKRADTLPSSSIPTLELPEDPKTWSPTHLAAYLSSPLRGGEVPTREIVAFVKERQMTGKMFLRLNEGDLESSELPKPHQAHLLSASRSLRQNALRGRIWGSHNFPQHDDFSSNSANVDMGRRSRKTSVDSSNANGNGRVKDMIASLERPPSSDDDDDYVGRRSSSPNKNQRHSTTTAYSPSKEPASHSYSYSYSPNKTQRALPSRGTVHDLFSVPSPGVSAREDTRTEGGEETIKSPHQHQARLLPYPPLLTPVHTGSTPNLMDAAGLYELGYRLPLPLSSLPTGSSSAIPIPLGVGGPGQHARPLPLPPHTGHHLPIEPLKREGVATTVTVSDFGSVIHHPRPRPGVGVGVEGLVGYFDVPSDDVPSSSDNLHHAGAAPKSETEPETKPEPEPETETETEGGYDTAPSPSPSEGEDEDDGPSVADLLLSHHPITGAEAWELELGETVKRAGSAAGVGVVRTGRGMNLVRAGVGEEENEGDGGKRKESAKDEEEKLNINANANEGGKEMENEDVGDLEDKKPDLWSVFDLEPPRGVRGTLVGSVDGPSAVDLGANDAVDSHSAVDSNSAVDSHPLEPRDVDDSSALDLSPHTTDQDSTEHDLATRHEALNQHELALAARQARIEGMEERVGEMQRAVGYREDAVGRREEAVERREREVQEREGAVERREEAVGKREREVEEREGKVGVLEQAVNERERVLDQREFELEERSKRVEELQETRDALNASTLSNSWPITLFRSVVFRVLGDKTPSYLFSSSSSFNSNAPTTTTPQRRPRRDWEARRDLYLSTGGHGSYLVLVGIGVCAVVLKVLVRRLTGVGMWSWLKRRGRR
ncbi:uncharacterized protein LACBIDRAFT_388494 [Laccaria bicolor S238N-H82]|uniref:Uncharacterized protein n=1 Tax=Laccaria bicolor (strain S238N-H82 / ATCC MYA-4686) TaxID=486041 RepID=B0DDW6_LACBS|nr:uncharacterized protein LACBIDRAFT_388494 [Laccaria bicolor S238N-H82]EDR07290.1 hypothetical protein LACBIDRAFT_388494 [Laccaria bicolor S238N-H82]|eukprot:XP_001882221.1 hypothetical protein LACBIDRAFT_388494 [Laccaria bicolor S238N-H82]